MYAIVVGVVCTLWIIRAIEASPLTSGFKYEEYVVEHEISTTQAKNSVMSIDLNSLKVPLSCQKCTQAEINYCMGKNLIADHCCCDKRFHEELSYIPHTCYVGVILCQPTLGDCLEYTRVRQCCCDRYVIQKWKEKSAADSPISVIDSKRLIAILFALVYYNVIN